MKWHEKMVDVPQILLVEDTRELLEDLALEIRDAGYEVIEASDGRSAISAFLEHRPDLVICDIQLPDIDGFTVLREIRKCTDGKVPMIIVSAFSDTALRTQANILEIDQFMVKPIDYDLLLQFAAQLI